ncbi:MAG: DUF3040 domain-containing protein [Nitriliruptoraceae bacterium]
MPLSEHEERILAEIERQLADDDPRFVARARRRRPRSGWSRQTRLRVAGAIGVLGVICIALLVVSIVFGAVGMIMVFGAIVLAVTANQEADRQAQHAAPPDERA